MGVAVRIPFSMKAGCRAGLRDGTLACARRSCGGQEYKWEGAGGDPESESEKLSKIKGGRW